MKNTKIRRKESFSSKGMIRKSRVENVLYSVRKELNAIIDRDLPVTTVLEIVDIIERNILK